MNATVRRATLTDASAIAVVHVETWQDAYTGLIPEGYLQSLSISDRTIKWQEMLADESSHAICLVGLIDGKVCGWSSLCKCRDADSGPKWGELGGMYIHPSAQAKGLGSLLMAESLALLRKEGYSQATLWVLTTNNSARSFYESRGWRVEGKTKTELRESFELHETRYIIDL